MSTVFFVCSSQDYDRLCHILVNQLNTSSSGYTLTMNANRGGLGHKQVSFMFGISYALLLGRRLRSGIVRKSSSVVYLDGVYWNNLNSCFRELRYDGRRSCGVP